jgi:ring-1,2-phenylacetyl-CoA epoxidase subunit PaaE
MTRFHNVQVQAVDQETADSVVVTLEIPPALHSEFQFAAGQYLTLKTHIGGQEIRRSYSLCSAPTDGTWKVGIKKVPGGVFSTFANEELRAGMSLDVMTPQGRFVLREGKGLHHVGFAAGSGITPILSQITEVLTKDHEATFTLFYANKTAASTMFREALQDLKDRHLNRLRLFYLLTREPVDADLLSGRLDGERCASLLSTFFQGQTPDAAYLCGPEPMILACRDALVAHGMPESEVRFELFTTSGDANANQVKEQSTASTGDAVPMQVVLDGVTTTLELPRNQNMLDAALDAGLDAPYSCLGGVCCTCRAKLVSGKASMKVNYALEPGEVERGFVLSCQAHVVGDEPVVLDYDQQ